MEYGYCSTTLIPCRSEPSDKSEMVNQLLFGETYQILERSEKWILINTVADNYKAWIDLKLHRELETSAFNEFNQSPKSVISDLVVKVHHKQSQSDVFLSHGAIIASLNRNSFKIGKDDYTLTNQLARPSALEEYVFEFLNTPYLWGGKSVFGLDCSGFTQIVFRVYGSWLPRDAYQQAELGATVSLTEVKSGDLAFFGNPDGKITHVGICLDGGKIIHCSGKCRIDVLDGQGIYNVDTKEYSHTLRIIKRL